MQEFYYYVENEKLNRFRIEQDWDPWNPREDFDGNIGHMMCWHRDYSLGDKNDYRDSKDFIDNLVRENISEKTIINYVRNGNASNKLEIKYNRSEGVYELMGYWRVWWNGNSVHHGVIADSEYLDWLIDDIIESLPISDKLTLLERKGFYFLPLAIYDHSGITMYVGSKYDHFDGQWDCSNVGWIYTTKQEVLETNGNLKGKRKLIKITERNWKRAAEEWLESEVKIYDQYLTGEVYGFVNEVWNGDKWEENDSCWGYYSDKWGEDLAREMANDGITASPFISEVEADKFIMKA